MSDETPVQPATPELDEAGSPEFARALEEFESGSGSSAQTAAAAATEVASGMKVKGRVVSIDGDTALVDFGGRSEGALETRHYRAEDGSLSIAVGDELELFVTESGDQITLAPSIKAEPHAALRQIRDAQAAGVPVTGKVTAVNSGGLEVDVAGVRGFCPLSQIENGFCAEPASYVGRSLEFLITAIEEARGSAVLSRRQLLRRAEEEEGKKRLATLKAGDELDGRVARLEPFGAFVDLGGVDGLVHVSEIRHERIGHPKEALKVGDKVHVRVLRLGTGKDGKSRVSLSIKAALADPWVGVEEQFKPGMRVNGTVARLTDFGAFVTLAPGIDGLVHVSETALHRINHVKDVLKVGQNVEASVLNVDPAKKRISLSIKELLAASMPPPRTPAIGDVIEGRIGGIKPFGVFVDLPEYGARVSGLLPREETGEPRGADLTKTYQVGQPLGVRVHEINEGKIRVVLAEGRPESAESAPAERSGAARGGASRGGASRGGAPRGGASRGEGPRGGESRGGSSRGSRGGGGGGSFSVPLTPAASNEPTTMAIALRKAMEEAKRKGQA